jgi:polysaccharide biosynthesis protein VpsM
MNDRFFRLILVTVVLILACFPVTAMCQGRMVIQPYIETGFQHDSNFFKSENDTKSVNTYYVKPGIEIGYTTDKSLIGIGYSLDFFRYDDRDDYLPGQRTAEDLDYTAHTGRFFAQTQATDRLRLELDNLFYVTRDAGFAETNDNSVDRFKYTLNSFTPGLVYDFGEKFGLGLKYNNLYIDYSDDDIGEGEDSIENRGIITLLYYFSSRTLFDLDYQFWKRDYDKDSVDYTSNQIMVNLEHQFNQLTLRGGVGYHKREFDDPIALGDRGAQDDFDEFVWAFSGTWEFPKSSLFMEFASNYNNSGAGNVYLTSTRLTGRFTHQLMEKLRVMFYGYYQDADYETSNRDDDRWLVSLIGEYMINDYFTLALSGGYEERDSNEAGRDFDNQYILANIRFNYDLGSR